MFHFYIILLSIFILLKRLLRISESLREKERNIE